MNIKHISILLSLLLALTLTGCRGGHSPLAPKEPTDEVDNKNHDDPKRIELILFDCHFHGFKVHATAEDVGTKYLRREQVMYLEEVPGKGWQISPDGVSRFIVYGGSSVPTDDPVDPSVRTWTDASFSPSADAQLADRKYALLVKLYNKEGKEITGQFATDGEDRRHQFFFTARSIRPTEYGDAALKGKYPDGDYRYMYYYYFDTTPWDQTMYDEGTRFSGISNPIGLKGFFEFPVADSRFDLQLTLLHARTSKFTGEGGRPSPFYGMSKRQRSTDVTDISLGGIPFIVFAHSGEFLESETKDLSTLSESDHLLVRKLASAAEISEEAALDDLWIIANSTPAGDDQSTGRKL